MPILPSRIIPDLNGNPPYACQGCRDNPVSVNRYFLHGAPSLQDSLLDSSNSRTSYRNVGLMFKSLIYSTSTRPPSGFSSKTMRTFSSPGSTIFLNLTTSPFFIPSSKLTHNINLFRLHVWLPYGWESSLSNPTLLSQLNNVACVTLYRSAIKFFLLPFFSNASISGLY